MLNCVYRLVAPRTFEPVEIEEQIGADTLVVRPTYLSICNADQRYYQGKRSAEALTQKLPMALIHEGIGKVVFDASGQYKPGTKVVMLPNNPCETNPNIGENYLRTSQFCGSGFDGFMQEYMGLPKTRVIELPRELNENVAAFTELVSVAMHAINRFDSIAHSGRQTVGVWGDGNLGFIVSLLLRMRYPDMNIFVIGRNSYKLNDFTFADRTYLSNDIQDLSVDHAFECCGGDGSTAAINQIINTIRPEGTLSLLGVSENPVPINTRMVLEKGLRLFGSSRSGAQDFIDVIELYEQKPEAVSYLESLVGDIYDVKGIPSAVAAFEGDMRKPMGKTIMQWNV